MPLPEVVVYATFSTEQVASRGSVTFTDLQFSVDSADGTINTPVRIVAHLDQNGYMRARLPLNTAPDTTPQPRSYHCDIAVEAYTQSFDFVLSPQWSEIDLAVILPLGSPPSLSAQYVSSIAGMTGNISAQALADVIGPMDPLHGKSAYELWLQAGNTGTMDDFFRAYEGDQGPAGIQGQPGDPGPVGAQGIPGPVGPQGDDFTIDGVVNVAADLPDGRDRYTVYVTLQTQEFWLNIGNDQWQSLGSYKGVPGTPGDVTGGTLVATNYFVSPEPSRLDGWSSNVGSLSLVPSLTNPARTAISVIAQGAQTVPLILSSPQTATPALAGGDHLRFRAKAYTSVASGQVTIALIRRSTQTVLGSSTVVANPITADLTLDVVLASAVPANDMYVKVSRSVNAVNGEYLRTGDIMVALGSADMPFFDGSTPNDPTYNYAWVDQDGFSVSKKTTVTTKYILGLDNVDNTHDMDKPISTAVRSELDYVLNTAGKVKSVNLMVGDVIVDKNSVGLDQVANLSPASLPVSVQTQQALDGKADSTDLDALKLTDLADTTGTPTTGDAPVWNGAKFAYGGAVLKAKNLGPAQDLNSYIESGIWVQQLSTDAAGGQNYPAALAGMLEVVPSNNSNMVWQRYSVYGRSGLATDIDSDVEWHRCRYNGVWSAWRAQAWGKPFAWGSGFTTFGDTNDFAQNAGGEVYLDSVGKLRARGDSMVYNSKLSSHAPSTWPTGVVTMGVTSASGFPVSGILTSSMRADGGNWCVQFLATGPSSNILYWRYGSTTFGPWERIGGLVYSEASPLVAYSGWAMTSSYMNVYNRVVHIYGNIKRTGGVLTSPAGDITNTNMCYILSGLPYPTTAAGLTFTGGNTLFGGVVGTDRVLTISCISPGKSIDTGDSITFTAMYLTNTGV